MNVSVSPIRPRNLSAVAALLIPTVCLFWAFWPTFGELAEQWNHNPTYSYGYLVPIFAVALLWVRRGRLDPTALRPSWWGLAFLAAGLLLRLFGAFFYYTWFEELALLPCLAGLCVLAGGRAAWKWAWPSLLFLTFMIPLPYTVATMLSSPLQRLATICSAFVMQTFGMPALADGNTILLGEHTIDIVEACSGLRMLMVFFALAVAFVMLVKRPWPDKVLLLSSAVPIALVSNIARIVLTGVLFETGVNSEAVHAFFHDAAGWLMMPFALVLLWAELTVMSRLLIDPPPAPVRTARTPAAVRRTPVSQRPARARKPVVREPERECEPSHAAAHPAEG